MFRRQSVPPIFRVMLCKCQLRNAATKHRRVHDKCILRTSAVTNSSGSRFATEKFFFFFCQDQDAKCSLKFFNSACFGDLTGTSCPCWKVVAAEKFRWITWNIGNRWKSDGNRKKNGTMEKYGRCEMSRRGKCPTNWFFVAFHLRGWGQSPFGGQHFTDLGSCFCRYDIGDTSMHCGIILGKVCKHRFKHRVAINKY